MKTLINGLGMIAGVMLLGGCGMIATDYVEMGAYVKTVNGLSGEVKGKSYCFLPEEGNKAEGSFGLDILKERFEIVGMKEVPKIEEADFVVVVAYGLGEERMIQLPERGIRTGSQGWPEALGKAGYVGSGSGGMSTPEAVDRGALFPTGSEKSIAGGGAVEGRVKILALALIVGKEWRMKRDKSKECYSGRVVVYGGGDNLEKLFPRMAGYLFEGFPGKKVSERVVTFRMRAGEMAGGGAGK